MHATSFNHIRSLAGRTVIDNFFIQTDIFFEENNDTTQAMIFYGKKPKIGIGIESDLMEVVGDKLGVKYSV